MFFAPRHTDPHNTTAARPGTSCPVRAPRTARGGAVVVALLLAACAHSPHAAVATNGMAEVHGSGSSSAAGCRETPAARAALLSISRDLQAQGMALKAHCQVGSGGWVVQVKVTDGLKASAVVRGPLADGHDVDMGTPAGGRLAGAPTSADGFSPDVQYNRQWLHALMARHQFDNLPDAWWHFAQRGTAPAHVGETDIAAR
jgi:zinc D-Ala-D-Ala dipeptidase